MMDSIGSTIVWCVLQVSLVALAGVVLSLLVARRNSFAAGSIVCMAAAVSAVLTLVAPLPIHRWFMLETHPVSVVAETTPIVLPGRPETGARDALHPASTPVPMWNLRELTVSLRSLVTQAESFEKRGSTVLQSVLWFLAAAIVMGLLRLTVGIVFVLRLRRKGAPITDPKLLDSLEKLATSLHCRAVPEIRENREFTDAAVAGWLRPTLILPYGWQQWTADEQQAVLAHELVHIVRRDSLWRALASSVLAIHFYNPVMHWLLRRVVLYQELSADVLAAEAVGQQPYLRSLSSLAIRRDDQLGRSVSPGVLPVFSGQLIRRIKVLHSMDGSWETRSRRWRNIASAMTAMAFLAMGFAAVATRGIAQPPSGEQKPGTGSVKSVSLTSAVTENKSGLDPTREMFRRSPLDPVSVGESQQNGMVAIRPRELLSRPELKSYTPALNGFLATWMASELQSKSPPAISTETIEWMAAVPTVSFKAETKDKQSQAMFGVNGLVIKLSQPLDLKQWVARFAPDAKGHVIEGQDVFQLTFASLGPVPCCVWMGDETTIRVVLYQKEIVPETKLSELNLIPAAKRSSSPEGTNAESAPKGKSWPWTATWNRIDSGIGSIVLAQADLSGLFSDLDNKPDFQNEPTQTIGRAYRALMSRCTTSAFSFDIPDGTSQFGVRFSLMHASRAAAVESAQNVREMLTLAKGELTKHLNTLNETSAADGIDRDLIRVCDDALQGATVSVDEYDDETAAVVIATALPFDKVVELAIQLINDSPSE